MNSQVYSGTESLNIQVSDFDQYTRENFIGQITIPLRSLNDQNTITQEYQLYNQNGHLKTGGSVVLQLQYVYSRVKFLEQIITQKNEEISGIENDLMEFERDIETLYQPFKALQRFYRNPTTMLAKNENEYVSNNPNLAKSNANVYRMQHEEEQIKAIPLGPDPYENIGLYTRILTISFLVITLASCFERAPYFDLMIIFFYVYKYEMNDLNETSCVKILTAIISSIILDIFWLVFFAEHWWNPLEEQLYDSMLDSGFRKANVVVSFLSIINKIFLAACFWGLIQYFKNNPVEEQLEMIKNKNQISPRRQFLQDQRPYLENSDYKVDKIFQTPEQINTNKSYITYQDQSMNQQQFQYQQPKY